MARCDASAHSHRPMGVTTHGPALSGSGTGRLASRSGGVRSQKSSSMSSQSAASNESPKSARAASCCALRPRLAGIIFTLSLPAPAPA